MKLFSSCQKGRSMIEMLGVLALVGILSVNGIAGFSRAMVQYRMNKSIEDYIFFINGILQNKTLIFKTKEYHIAPFLNMLGILPQNWTVQGALFYDKNGNEVFPYKPSTFNIEFRLKKTTSFFTPDNFLFCQKIWMTIIQPYSDALYQVYLKNSDTIRAIYYGSQYCTPDRLCLSAITPSVISEDCSSCTEEDRCVLNFTFK